MDQDTQKKVRAGYNLITWGWDSLIIAIVFLLLGAFFPDIISHHYSTVFATLFAIICVCSFIVGYIIVSKQAHALAQDSNRELTVEERFFVEQYEEVPRQSAESIHRTGDADFDEFLAKTIGKSSFGRSNALRKRYCSENSLVSHFVVMIGLTLMILSPLFFY